MAIDFELDESQQELQGAARRLFEETGGLGLARDLLETGGGHSTELWRRMADLGWVGLTIPEEHGGGGGNLLDAYALFLEMGRYLVTSPLLPSSVIAGHVLAHAGSEGQRSAWLPGMAAGEHVVVPATLEPSGTWDESGIELVVSRGSSTATLQGTKVLVPFAGTADRLLVAGRDAEAGGITLVLVDPATEGVTISPVDNLAALPLFTVELSGAEVPLDAVVGEPGQGWDVLAAAMSRGAVLRCAETAGAGDRILDMAVAYAKERVQFGTPIGKHQAVQYLCTDIAIDTHLTGLLSRRAAWLLDQGVPAAREVAAAKLYASRAAHQMTNRAHEVFAGVAFMMEHDLHLFTRHAKHWEHDLGDVRHHAEMLVRALEA